MENVDDNFINQLRCLIEEYGYQLPIETEKDTSFSFDGLKLVPENYQVFRNGTEIVLTGKEFEILMLLVQNKGKRQIFLRIS
jgi:DNA-binding response OmpR family regulator